MFSAFFFVNNRCVTGDAHREDITECAADKIPLEICQWTVPTRTKTRQHTAPMCRRGANGDLRCQVGIFGGHALSIHFNDRNLCDRHIINVWDHTIGQGGQGLVGQSGARAVEAVRIDRNVGPR